MPYYFLNVICVCVHFHYFCKYTLHASYIPEVYAGSFFNIHFLTNDAILPESLFMVYVRIKITIIFLHL